MSFHIPTDRSLAETARALIGASPGPMSSLTALASACGTSPHTLKRIFKKTYGQSVAAYCLRARMDRAKELLVTTNNTLQMIAEEVGYTEGNNFQQAFKRVTGCTPGAWRRRVWGEGTAQAEDGRS